MSPDQTPEPLVVHRQMSPHYSITDDNVLYPIDHRQLRDLLGRLLTQLDAMGLPDRAHRAAKTLLVGEVWRWWDGVAENATTSFDGCIAPIVMNDERVSGDGRPPSNRWGWPSETAYLDSLKPGATPAVEWSMPLVTTTAATGQLHASTITVGPTE